MNKEDFLKQIARESYNIGYGAKLSFSSFDILRLGPGIISFFSIATGIIGASCSEFPSKPISICFLILGVLSLYISTRLKLKDSYESSGIKLTKSFKKLETLYFKSKKIENDVSDEILSEFEKIVTDASENYIGDQLCLASWFAHPKFYGEAQMKWVEEELKLKFWKDKVPSTLKVTLFALLFIPILIVAVCLISKVLCNACSPI